MSAPLFPLLASWASWYGAHQLASVGIRFLHVSGLVVGGGTAISTDWRLLSAWRAPAAREDALARLAGSHRAVVPSLALVVVSGLAMAAADTETYLASWLFWVKMGLFATLLTNGLVLLAAARGVRRMVPAGWTPLALVSAVSLTLWFTLLFVGTWLTVAA